MNERAYRLRNHASHALFACGALLLAAWLGGCAAMSASEARATRALDRGQARVAYDVLAAELRTKPDDVETLLLFARSASTIGDDSSALEALARVGRHGKNRTELLETRRGIWQVAFQPALDILDTLERVSDTDRARARAAIRRARLYDPSAPGSAAGEGVLDLSEGRSARAESLFAAAEAAAETTTATKDAVVTSLLKASAIYMDHGSPDSAIGIARRAVRLSPDDTRALHDLGVTLHRAGEARSDTTWLREAARTFSAVLERLPDDTNARYNLALTHYRLGEFEVAEREILDLLAMAPVQGRAHHLLARLRLRRGDRTAATVPLTATRAIDGVEHPVPSSVLDVSGTAGKEGRKRFVLDGPPARIFSYTEKSGAEVELWFYVKSPAAVVFSGGRLLAEERFLSDRPATVANANGSSP